MAQALTGKLLALHHFSSCIQPLGSTSILSSCELQKSDALDVTNCSGLVAFLNTSTDLETLTVLGLVPLLHHKSLRCLFLIQHCHNHMTYFRSQKIQMKAALMTIQTHNPHLVSSLQHEPCTDPEEISDETLDAADVMDTDVFEELQQYSDQCSMGDHPKSRKDQWP